MEPDMAIFVEDCPWRYLGWWSKQRWPEEEREWTGRLLQELLMSLVSCHQRLVPVKGRMNEWSILSLRIFLIDSHLDILGWEKACVNVGGPEGNFAKQPDICSRYTFHRIFILGSGWVRGSGPWKLMLTLGSSHFFTFICGILQSFSHQPTFVCNVLSACTPSLCSTK